MVEESDVPARSLTETGNFRPEVAPVDAGATSNLYFMSEEFRSLAKMTLRESGFMPRGRRKYSVGMFCLGQSLELTYKSLLRRDGIGYRKGHDLDELFGLMGCEVKRGVASIVRGAGWGSCEEFHLFVGEHIKPVDRKYHEASSIYDHWTRDQTGQRIGHKLWPRVFALCEELHQYAASMIWIDVRLPEDP